MQLNAAIAANAVLGVVEPTGAGIGGDLFAMIWSADKGKLYGLNGSGRSPRSLKLEYFKDNGYEFIPSYGPLPVSVPGCVDAWYEMHDMFGRLFNEGYSATGDKLCQGRLSGNGSHCIYLRREQIPSRSILILKKFICGAAKLPQKAKYLRIRFWQPPLKNS